MNLTSQSPYGTIEELANSKTYRIMITYSGFSESKNEKLIAAVGKAPAQRTYDPAKDRTTLDFTFRSPQAAGHGRTRAVVEQKRGNAYTISKVTHDSF